MSNEEVMQKVEVKGDEFSGLIGNIAGNFIRDKVGGPGGDILAGLAGNAFGGGGGGGGGFFGGGGQPQPPVEPKSKGNQALDFIGGLIGGKKDGTKGSKGGGGASGFNDGGFGGGGGGGARPPQGGGGGFNLNDIGAAHRFLGVDPATGRIIGAVAGNVIMGLGGKDNSLGNIGKVILDNIISGKFRRDVDPFVRPEPRPDRGGGPSPIQPIPAHEPLDFYAERDKCLAEKRLFEDPHFPAQDSSLFYSKSPPKRVDWLRPGVRYLSTFKLLIHAHTNM
ncbi:unnamed protein product [Heligmosomoides polygyrus]|uniref:Calpain clp-1 n=1 Tax=Heligmosomoides polygyrus TaxID=6339 RepID=A0A3P7YRS2_HELPZ|nr:unnamed protein product [Heligmosomoides polygyrus]